MTAKLKLGPRVNQIPPAHLSESSRQLWSEIVEAYTVRDAPGLAILTSGLEARDRAAEARKVLDDEGLTVTGDRGSVKKKTFKNWSVIKFPMCNVKCKLNRPPYLEEERGTEG